MASPKPVPSRAAIHALRGVIFTTSCSVILLAEERRRRIEIARAAIDNARKLHTVRTSHTPALSESFARREAWPGELLEGHEPIPNSVPPRPRGPVRRKRRAEHPDCKSPPSEDVRDTSPVAKEAIPSTEADSFEKRWAEFDAMRKEVSRISSSPFAHHELFLRLSEDNEAPSINVDRNQQSPSPNSSRTVDTAPKVSPTEVDNLEPRSVERDSISDIGLQPDGYNGDTRNTLVNRKTVSLRKDDLDDQDDHIQSTADARSIPESQIDQPMANHDTEAQSNPQESLDSLNRLLRDLELNKLSRNKQRHSLDLAVDLFPTLVSSTDLGTDYVIARALTLLEASCSLRAWEHIVPIIRATLPVCNDPIQLLEPFVDFIRQQDARKGFRELLVHPHRFQMRRSKDLPSQGHRSWITELLDRTWQKTKNFREVQLTYNFFRQCGMFTHRCVPQATKHAIRRRYIMIALSNGLLDLAAKEAKQSERYMPSQIRIDGELRASFIVQKAQQGDWEKVDADVCRLRKLKGVRCRSYQRVLAKLTTIFARNHSPDEVDDFVRDLIADKQMDLNMPLAHLVIERHGQNRDMESLIKWLKFCQQNGLEMDEGFFHKVANSCHQHWNFEARDLRNLYASLRSLVPWSTEPRVSKYCVSGGLVDILGAKSSRVSHLEEASALTSILEPEAFQMMNAQALEKKWEQVLETFSTALDKCMSFSSRCLRLAVVASIRKDGGSTENATKLVASAREEGNDVSSALVPLLVARLEAGESAQALIRATLRDGESIHDSVFNKAARHLIESGNPRGAVNLCHVAAKENGQGQLLYCKYNFTNLAYAYTCLGRYDDLIALMSAFTSDMVWWHGSKECKETIKLALKRVKTRASSEAAEQCRHNKARICLEGGLEHVKAVRASLKQDRQMLTDGIVGVFKSGPVEQNNELPIQDIGRQVEGESAASHETAAATNTPQIKSSRPLQQREMNMDIQHGSSKQSSSKRTCSEHFQGRLEREEMVLPARSLAGEAF